MCSNEELEALIMNFIRSLETGDRELMDSVFHDDFDFYPEYTPSYFQSRKASLHHKAARGLFPSVLKCLHRGSHCLR